MTLGIAEGKALKDVAVGFNQAIDKLKNFGPEVQSLRVDYQDRSSVLKMKVKVPESGLTALRKLQVPDVPGFKIEEVWDTGFNKIPVSWEESGRKWLASARQFNRGEVLQVIFRGRVPPEALAELVDVRAPLNPTRKMDHDLYWLHSAIRDVGMLENIYEDLNIDRVNLAVGVGVERSFSSSIPERIGNVFEARKELQAALSGKQRELQRLRAKLRTAETLAGHATIQQVLSVMDKLVSGEAFESYVGLDAPYQVTNITPKRETSLIPTNVNVGVMTDLSLSQPAVKGNLSFAKKAFQERVAQDFSEILKE